MSTVGCRKKVKPGAISVDNHGASLVIEIETQVINQNDQILSKSQSQKRLALWHIEMLCFHDRFLLRVDLHQFLSATNLTEAAATIVSDCKYIHKSKVVLVEGLLRQCIEYQQQRAAAEAAPIVSPVKSDAISDKSDSDNDALDERTEKPLDSAPKKPAIRRKSIPKSESDQPNDESKSEVVQANKEPKSPAKPKRPKEKAAIDQLDAYLELLYEENIDEVVRSTGLIAQLARIPEHLSILCNNGTAIGALTRILNENRKKHTDLVVNALDIFRSISKYSQLHAVLLNNKIGDTTMKILDLECKRYDIHKNSPSEKMAPKFVSKQHKVLNLVFSILLNLAEDVQIEVKMVNRGIITYLVSTLSRETSEQSKNLIDLRLLALTILKKLSIMKENVNAMSQSDLISILAQLDVSTESVLIALLRLLFNLSFHPGARDLILKESTFLETASKGLHSTNETCQLIAGRLLYNMTVHQKGREAVASSHSIVSFVSNLIIHAPARLVPNHLIGLAINLSTVETAAAIMCEKDVMSALVKRTLTTTDFLLVKLLHNLSIHSGKGKEHLNKYLADFISLAKRSQRNEVLMETLGIIGNLDQSGMSFARIVSNSDFIDFLVKHLIPGFTDDDIVLAVVVIIGTLSADPQCVPLLTNPRLVRLLTDTLTEKFDDQEIILQTVFCISRLICYDETRNLLFAIPNLMDVLINIQKNDSNALIQNVAAQCIAISIVQASDSERDKIKDAIFELHNFEWMKASSVSNGDINGPKSSMQSDDDRGENYGWNSREPSPIEQWPDSSHIDEEFGDELY